MTTKDYKYYDILLKFISENDLINKNGFRSKIDIRNEKIGYKIREGTLQRIPLIAIIGDQEEVDNTVSLRALDGKNLGKFNTEKLFAFMNKLISKKGRID